MSEQGKRIENWFRLARLCHERHVPSDIEIRWNMELLALPDRASKEEYALEKIAEVERLYPYVPVERFLAEVEANQDWDKLRSSMYVYWKDVPSVLADAVRTGCANTVRQLALHCLFDNDKLLEKMLRLASDDETRSALTERMGIREEEHYRNYPFCIKENSLFYCLQFQTVGKAIISMPEDVQQVSFDRLVQSGKFGSEQEMLGQMRALKPESQGRTALEFALYGLGCEATDKGFVFRPIPDYWTESKYAKNIWQCEDSHSGLTFLRSAMEGYAFQFDGLNNLFGYTGYYYLEKWP